MNKLMLIGILLALASGVGYLLAILAYIETHTLNTKCLVWGGFAVMADMACVGCFIVGNKARQSPPTEYR